MSNAFRATLFAAAFVLSLRISPVAPAADSKFTAEQVRFFETQVQPILKTNCLVCHGGGRVSGGLNLTSREGIFKGGGSGPAVIAGKSAESLLVKAINYAGPKMPPQGKLPQTQIDVLTRWIQMGLPWTPSEASPDKPAVRRGPPPVNAETMKFWSFQPVKCPTIPKVKNAAGVKNPIDAFILAKLEAAGLTPAKPAEKTQLLRRVYYDLIGLPPSPEDVRGFLADRSPQAYERVVDRLLASPQYGERWARKWLDLVRYAETNSFERDDPKPFVWRYRDYVIKSFNDDKPYDQFIREQLAGDELDHVTNETLVATGFHRLGQWDDEPADPLLARYDDLDDILTTTTQAFLGLTVNCARCHDHKLDPIPQKDYYRMLAFFQGLRRYGVRSPETVASASLRPITSDDDRKRFEAESNDHRKKLTEVNTQLAEIEKVAVKDFSPVEKEEFQAEQSKIPLIRKRVPNLISEETFKQYQDLRRERFRLMRNPPRSLAMALCVTESFTAVKTHVLMRGNPHVEGDEVEPGFLSVLAPPSPVITPRTQTCGRRLALANWIASPANQLTARVMMNRIWQGHFGRGIVKSPNNFGMLGTPPTHSELLDWLASEFVSSGWRLKAMHKTMLMSNTYRMSGECRVASDERRPRSSTARPFSSLDTPVGTTDRLSSLNTRHSPLDVDPENDLFWRFNMRRLEAEEIRDSLLAINGSLNPKMFGPSIYPTIPEEVLAGQSKPGYGWEKSTPEEAARRSVYIHIKRSLIVPMMASFDGADTDFSCPVRFATTQPTQALSMLNSAFVNEQAKLFADRLQKQASDVNAQVKLGLSRVMQREPTAKEIARGVALIKSMRDDHKRSAAEALQYFCLMALNLNEFVYLD